jgi:hypothetical protein
MTLNILYEQIDGFTLYSIDTCNIPPITSLAGIPPAIRGLEKYFSLKTPCWIKQHGKGVRRKTEGVEVEPPKPKKNSSGLKFDDDTDFNVQGTSSLAVTLHPSANKHLKPATNRVR